MEDLSRQRSRSTCVTASARCADRSSWRVGASTAQTACGHDSTNQFTLHKEPRMGSLANTLTILSLATEAAQGLLSGDAAKADLIAANLVKIAQAASSAYQQHTGLPIDPNALQPIS